MCSLEVTPQHLPPTNPQLANRLNTTETNAKHPFPEALVYSSWFSGFALGLEGFSCLTFPGAGLHGFGLGDPIPPLNRKPSQILNPEP